MRGGVEARGLQCAKHFIDVLRPARLQNELELGILDRQRGKRALMFDFLNICCEPVDQHEPCRVR